jgi:hypothetical protein
MPPSIPASLKGKVALLTIGSYSNWLLQVGKKTRNMIRKSQRCGVTVVPVRVDDEFVCGVWRIYNETPVRQQRSFCHYGVSLDVVRGQLLNCLDSFFGAYFDGELVGFVQLKRCQDTSVISQILSLKKHWSKAVNNALIAKVVEYCDCTGVKYLVYARFGNHPSLDAFKRSNGFVEYDVGGRCGLQDYVPSFLKPQFISVYNYVSRLRVRAKLKTS